jgi:formylglycine-generating enzyme required for sulfatase activity
MTSRETKDLTFTLAGNHEAAPWVLIWVPAGSFILGDGRFELYSDDYRDYPVEMSLSTGFWIQDAPVTQSQWRLSGLVDPSTFQGPQLPVESVTWFEAMEYVDWLNKTVLTRPAGFSFTLPTELQWEYAWAAGSLTRFSSGDSEDDLAKVAWHQENSDGRTQPVKTKAPNAWGIFDMHGNVFEWCLDWATDYPTKPVTDWCGPSHGWSKVNRGGSWGTPAQASDLETRSRGHCEPLARSSGFGFRVCLSKNVAHQE